MTLNLIKVQDEIVETKLYEPAKNMKENKLREYLKLRWKDKYKY